MAAAALRTARLAAAEALTTGDEVGVGQALAQSAAIACDQADYAAAQPLAEQALRLGLEFPDRGVDQPVVHLSSAGTTSSVTTTVLMPIVIDIRGEVDDGVNAVPGDANLERWLVTGGSQGGPLAFRNTWAVIGLASGDPAFSDRCVGLLERPEDISRARSRLAKQGLPELAPRLRRRASPLVLRLPPPLAAALEQDASLVLTGLSAARPYGWTELNPAGQGWRLDAYLPLEAFSALQQHADRSAADTGSDSDTDAVPVMLRVVDEPWPFPPHYQLAPQPLAALDLLEYPCRTSKRRVAIERSAVRAASRAASGPMTASIKDSLVLKPTIRLSRSPARARRSRYSSADRSRPPVNASIMTSKGLLGCGLSPGGSTDSSTSSRPRAASRRARCAGSSGLAPGPSRGQCARGSGRRLRHGNRLHEVALHHRAPLRETTLGDRRACVGDNRLAFEQYTGADADWQSGWR